VNVTVTANIAIAVLGVLAAWVQTRRNVGGGRDQLRRDVKLYNSLPEESTSRAELLAHIDKQILRLIGNEEELARDPAGIFLAVVILAGAGALSYAAVDLGSIWWILLGPAGFLAILGSVGLGQDLPRRKRDERGRKVADKGERVDAGATQRPENGNDSPPSSSQLPSPGGAATASMIGVANREATPPGRH
jgi:hypothetical protein